MGCERSNLEDQLLVMDAQDGSRAAMEQIVGRWQKRLWRHALRLTGDNSAAWDVTQAAWYDIIRRLQSLHDPAAFRAWAYKITTCRAMDWLKKNHLAMRIPTEGMEAFAAEVRPETGMDELLERLDVDKRVVVSLYYFEELSVSEIGMVLKIPDGTVKSRLHAARNELKILWEKARG